jgi:hypothetical protein
MGKQIRFAMIIFCILIFSALAHATDRGRGNAESPKIELVSFTILDPDSHEVIGHAKYRIEHLKSRIMVWGENHYNNGEHDIERDASRSTRTTPCRRWSTLSTRFSMRMALQS